MRNQSEVTTSLLGRIVEVAYGGNHDHGKRGIIVCLFPATTRGQSVHQGLNGQHFARESIVDYKTSMMVHLQFPDGEFSDALKLEQLKACDSLEIPESEEEDDGERVEYDDPDDNFDPANES